ncbi:16262_t:CDS:2 [Cetraspora pellucida]|uniref:16262_t:CDS:1 n=1 Tax=Cetraspora pellucida TaxID=1433469 RepID=A0A9N8ZHL6_9GLOM|nr:16262_t:CDS:2 [Cetraspora pellucida]
MISYLYIIILLIEVINTSTYLLPASKCPREDSLRKCLDQHIKGTVNYRDDFFSYNTDLNVEYNQRIIYFPVAFVRPIDVIDVQNTIKCGAKLNYPIVARSGGHSSESYSLGDRDCYLVIDLITLNEVTVDITSQTAIIGTGNTLNPLYYAINQYEFAFPGGLCPHVGVGGHIMGGGMGLIARRFGYASDSILDAQIVLANGTVVNNVKEHPELLWAIRGAGNAGYGIVTSLTLRIYPIPKTVAYHSFTYDMNQIPSLISVINQLGYNLHQNLTFATAIFESQVHVNGIYLGPVDELQLHMQEFIKLSKPKSVSYIEDDLYNVILYDSGSASNHSDFKIKSFYIDSTGLSDEGVNYLMKFVERFKCKIGVDFSLIGGGVDKFRRNETAYVHRGFLYHLKLKAFTPTEECLQDLGMFSQNFQRKYTSYESYQNHIDRQLDNWQCRYYGENFGRLVEIKRKYDPYNLFRWNQSISTNTRISCY